MNAQLRHVMIVLLACFCLLFLQLNRVQIFQADALQENDANNRGAQRDFNRDRAEIVTSDGVVVARSEPSDGFFSRQRVYPEGELYAHTVGYVSFTVGTEGVERTANDAITGQTAAQQLDDLTNLLDPDPEVGSVVLTLDHELQSTARAALGQRAGSVVALDPRTGAIKALWSYPSFDPNTVASNDTNAANAAYLELLETEGNPLRAKAFRDVFFPGSTFKIVTAAAGIEEDVITLTEPVFPQSAQYVPPLTTRPITNFGGRECGGNLIELLVRSCNVQFAELAAEQIGPGKMEQQARANGFNEIPPIDLPGAVESIYPLPETFGARLEDPSPERPAGLFENTPLLAQSGIGQFEVQGSPLLMALIAAGVANDGEIPSPHVLAEVRDADGGVLSRNQPSGWRRSMEPETAQALQEALLQAGREGSGNTASVSGLDVSVKTGTAQLGTDPPRSNAWIVGYAGLPGGEPELAVAVLVEGQEGSGDQTGGRVAGPIARELFAAYFAGRL
ncbi:MAG: penicillin-binding protein 2 [Actinomycetota bacterium]